MKAIVGEKYGPAESLRLIDVASPAVDAGSVLVRVRAAALNPMDLYLMRGEPLMMRPMLGFPRPKRTVPGVDLAGLVEQIGTDVTTLRPGDEVFGAGSGTLAEKVRAAERDLVLKPAGTTFEEAAGVPMAGLTALQAVRDHARVQPGQRLLVNGAAGGVGTFVVQMAKEQGARVTGVCGPKNAELVSSIGAVEVIDYTKADFARPNEPYDVLIDAVGNRSLRELRHTVKRDGTIVLCGGGGGRFLGPIGQILRARLVDRFVSQRLVTFVAKTNQADLLTLKELVESGQIRPVLDRCYPLAQAAEAIRYLEARHARGKVIVSLSPCVDPKEG